MGLTGKKSGAALARLALEQLPIQYTFGIPGVHNTELYDELARSEKIRPVLVTHECCAAFMGDAVSRTAPPNIGCLLIVPAAGLTHAMSGIGEAYLDGIPLLVISGGIRTDLDYGYQLHEIDQLALASSVTKAAWKVGAHEEIVPTLFEAYATAVSGVPGPVLVEIPVNIQLFAGSVSEIQELDFAPISPSLDQAAVDSAAEMLAEAEKPGIFVGWGAVDVSDSMVAIAERLGAPVATTLQGLSAFPGNHPLHTGMGFSEAAVPAATNAFRDVDVLLAVGTRFAEIPTGSFGCRVPDKLIHIDIDPDVIGRNFQEAIGIVADSRAAVPALADRLAVVVDRSPDRSERRARLEAQIAADKRRYREEWRSHKTGGRVNPVVFFDALRHQLKDDAIVVADDGNHTFLTAELLPIHGPRQFISPTDFNSMGYCVPAAIGARLAHPERQVVGVVGDGAFLMTAMELVTACTERLGVVLFVFNDGELSQISQGQEIPYGRKTCTVLGDIRLDGIATATGAEYVSVETDEQVASGIELALETARGGCPVIVDVRIDYSKRTRFTEGVVKTVLSRFPLGDKLRFVVRAGWRRVGPGQKRSS